jgi:hypothetical protein
MNKAALILSSTLLWVFGSGCESTGTRAQVHVRVFEVPSEVLRQHVAGQRPERLPGSAYSVSVITPNNLNAMLRSDSVQQRLLAERTRVIDDWPAIADTWVYSPNDAGQDVASLYTGGGVGYLGVRNEGNNMKVRLDYMVNHRGPQGQKLIESQFFYKSGYHEGDVLLFHAPFKASDGSTERHVIAFEITRARPAPRSSSPDVLAFQ